MAHLTSYGTGEICRSSFNNGQRTQTVNSKPAAPANEVHVDSSSKYGSPATAHWKYNFLSAGRSTIRSSNFESRPSVFNATTTTSRSDNRADDMVLTTQKKLWEEEQRRAAAGLGYGAKHPSHYTYSSPHAKQKRLSDDMSQYTHVDDNQVARTYRNHVANAIGYGRHGKYHFSAFARTGPMAAVH